jgi:hypothetical protein
VTQHPITPPPELRAQWRQEAPRYRDCGVTREDWLIDSAAQWGADQELEACCEWIHNETSDECFVANLRAARRPKSEKQQALEDLDALQADLANYGMGFKATNIRRALESIPDDQ